MDLPRKRFGTDSTVVYTDEGLLRISDIEPEPVRIILNGCADEAATPRIDRNRKMGSFGAKPQNGLRSACSLWECVGLPALWNRCPRRTRHAGKREQAPRTPKETPPRTLSTSFVKGPGCPQSLTLGSFRETAMSMMKAIPALKV